MFVIINMSKIFEKKIISTCMISVHKISHDLAFCELSNSKLKYRFRTDHAKSVLTYVVVLSFYTKKKSIIKAV